MKKVKKWLIKKLIGKQCIFYMDLDSDHIIQDGKMHEYTIQLNVQTNKGIKINNVSVK